MRYLVAVLLLTSGCTIQVHEEPPACTLDAGIVKLDNMCGGKRCCVCKDDRGDDQIFTCR